MASDPIASDKQLFAVIELGTTSVRMAIASRKNDGSIMHIENLHQPLALGKDTFTMGIIGSETTEACVEALKNFQIILSEYEIRPENIRAIATSAVREAENKEAFIDRIYVATNLAVDVIDEAEVNRFTYLAVHSIMGDSADMKDGEAIIVEVGGGSTDIIQLENGNVIGAQGYRLGSLRLSKLLDEERVPHARFEKVLSMHVARGVGQICHSLHHNENCVLVALGGDARFAASMIDKKLSLIHI